MARSLALVLVLFGTTSSSLARAQANSESERAFRFTLSSGFDFSTGKYGATSTTKILYIPFALKIERGPFEIKVSVPYLNVSGPGVGGEQPLVNGSGAGVGDVGLMLAYTFTPDSLRLPVVTLSGKIKFGTADVDKGIGTGENDYILQVDVDHFFGKFSPFITVNYRFVGDSPEYDLHNTWFASLGLGCQQLDFATQVGQARVCSRNARREGQTQ